MGMSLEDLRDLPQNARHDTGYQLEQVQFGLGPTAGSPCPMWVLEPGRSGSTPRMGAIRVFCVTKFGDKVHVLHCFTKKLRRRRLTAERRCTARPGRHASERSGKGDDDERVG